MSIRSTITVLALAAGIACAGTALASDAEAATTPGDHAWSGVAAGDLAQSATGVPVPPPEGDWRLPQCLLCWIPGRPDPTREDISPAQAF